MNNKNQLCNIDIELAKNRLCRLQEFKYNVDNFLFDSVEYLLDFTKNSRPTKWYNRLLFNVP